MKWWSCSREGKCTCGARSMARAKFWKFLFSASATRQQQYDCCVNFFVARALSRRLSSLINLDLTEPRFVSLAFWVRTSKTACQQPRGEFPSACSTTRTKDAGLQISQIRSALRICSCGGLQHLQCSAAFDEPPDASTVSNRRASILERCNSCGSINREHRI